MDNDLALKTTLTELNPWWDDPSFRFDVIERSSFSHLLSSNSKTIEVFIGARRVGKTSIMKSIINHLLDSKVSHRQIIYFVTDARVSHNLTPEDIIRYVQKTFNLTHHEQLYLFIDEVQDMPDWQRGIKYLYDNLNIKIYVTGSSSLILRPQTSKLTGRFVLHEVLGLSFTEYLEFTKQKLSKNQVKNIELVTTYLQIGGYPEYVLGQDRQALTNIIESTLYRDLISQYGIRNPAFLKDLLDYLADKVTSPVSNTNIAKDLGVNDDTAKFYLQYLQDVYLIYPVYRKSKSNKISKSSVPKYYFNDTGVLNIRSLAPLTYSEISSISPKLTSSLEKLIFTGSYPRIYEKKLDPTTWYGEYVSTYVERDLRELIQVGNLGTFLKFLRLLAGRTGQILNLSSLASDSGITHNTAKSWISILETSFIVFLLPPHYQNFNKQIIKAPKLYFYDTGLVCYLLGITSSSQLFTNPLIGHLFETWVISEYFKNTFAHKHNPNIYYYWRDKLGHEIDLLITLGNQTMLPIEIKYGQTINSDFFKNITYYQSLAKDNAPESTIIYGGKLKYSKNHTQIIPWFDL